MWIQVSPHISESPTASPPLSKAQACDSHRQKKEKKKQTAREIRTPIVSGGLLRNTKEKGEENIEP